MNNKISSQIKNVKNKKRRTGFAGKKKTKTEKTVILKKKRRTKHLE